MLSVWKHFTLCNLLLLGERKDFVQVGFGGLYFFQMCCLFVFAKVMHPVSSHCAYSCLQLLTPELDFGSFPPRSAGQDGPRSRGSAAMRGLLRSSRPGLGEQREKLSLKTKVKGQKGLVSSSLLLAGNSGRSQALRRPLEWQHTKSLSPLRCASCVRLPICAGKMNVSKFTASFRFQGTERKRVQAAREGRSRCLWRLCCSQSIMTLLSAVKLCCPGRTDCKIHLVNVE